MSIDIYFNYALKVTTFFVSNGEFGPGRVLKDKSTNPDTG